jgi:hypothetical protein
MLRNQDDMKWFPELRSPWWEDGQTKEDDKMRLIVVHALMFGSAIRSPLLHACSSVHEAYKWNSRAANSEKRRKDLGLMCRVDLEIVGEENVIDLSTDAAQHVVGTVYLCGTGTVGTVGTIYLCTTGTVGTVFLCGTRQLNICTYGSQPSEQHGWQSSSTSSWNHTEAHASWTYGSQPFIFQQPRRSSNRSTSWSGGRR